MVTAAMLALVFTAQPAFWSGGPRSHVRLVADAPVDVPPELSSYAGWSKEQLRAEYDRLALTRPSIGLPIALMVTGGGAFLTAFYFFLGFGGLNGGPGAVPLYLLLGVAGLVAAAAIVVGGIVLTRLLPARRAIGRQLDAIERLAEARPSERRRPVETPVPEYREPDIIGPPPEGPPPLPLPPMPPSTALVVPIFLARF